MARENMRMDGMVSNQLTGTKATGFEAVLGMNHSAPSASTLNIMQPPLHTRS